MLSLNCFFSVDLVPKVLGSAKKSLVFGRRRGVRCLVSLAQNAAVDVRDSGSDAGASVSSLLETVSEDLLRLNNNLKTLIGDENPVLISAAEQIFGAGGKRLRPALTFLVSRATAEIAGLKELTTQHQRLAEVIELIHTATLIHDDVLDDSEM